MKYIIISTLFFQIVSCNAEKRTYSPTEAFELAPPIIEVDSILFKETATISLLLNLPKSEIRYTTDKSAVTVKSPLYKSLLNIKESSTINIRAFHPDYKASTQKTVQVTQIKKNISDALVTLSSEPSSNYKGNGPKSLIDLQKGTLQFRNGQKWLGFQKKKMTIAIDFKKITTISKVIVSNLIDQNGWIFSPKKITVHRNDKVLGSFQSDKAAQKRSSKLQFIEISVPPDEYKSLEIEIHSLEKLPDWHPGKGKTPWLFIDEILIE